MSQPQFTAQTERKYQSSASALSRHRAAIKWLPGAGKHTMVAFISKVTNKDSFSFLYIHSLNVHSLLASNYDPRPVAGIVLICVFLF